jgi:ABC-type Zn uptake system ZnuABC Zn-binding protein ZnuA
MVIVGITLILNNAHQQTEQFLDLQAPFPRIKQASFIPTGASTATTARPELAKPDIREYVEAHDSFEYLLAAYNPAAVERAGVSTSLVATTVQQAVAGIEKIRQYIRKPESVPSREILTQAATARAIADRIRRVGPADPWVMMNEEPGHNDANYYCSDTLRFTGI